MELWPCSLSVNVYDKMKSACTTTSHNRWRKGAQLGLNTTSETSTDVILKTG